MNIIVIGDVILDINKFCEIKRTIAGKNIPIYNVLKTENILGGAANVANNLHNLDRRKCIVELVSVIGNDREGENLKCIMNDKNIKHKLFIDRTRNTTVKTRIFNNHDDNIDILSRSDVEDTIDIDCEIEDQIIKYIFSVENIHAIVFSDYNNGVLTEKICRVLIDYSNKHGIYTFVDPKIKNTSKYRDCFCIKPNLKEGIHMTNKTNIHEIITSIKDIIQCKHVLLTCDKEGMYIDDASNHIRNKKNIGIVDVTGCGDVVLSTFVFCFLQNNDVIKSAKISNYVANKSLQNIGNYLTSINDIEEYVDTVILETDIDKIYRIREQNKQIVFTNGCFDVIHSGHTRLLQFARSLGDILIVAINSDNSVRRLKGDDRPINGIEERCNMLLSLNIIDYIIIFDSSTPFSIMELLKPNIMVKGGDYKKENVVGKEFTKEVVIYNYIDGLSTTNTILKIKKI